MWPSSRRPLKISTTLSLSTVSVQLVCRGVCRLVSACMCCDFVFSCEFSSTSNSRNHSTSICSRIENILILHCMKHYAQYVPLHTHTPTHPDDLPIRGFIGHLEEGTFLPHNHKTYLWTHLHFAFEYNGDQVRNEEGRDGTVL